MNDGAGYEARGFHSPASFCASQICARVIFVVTA